MSKQECKGAPQQNSSAASRLLRCGIWVSFVVAALSVAFCAVGGLFLAGNVQHPPWYKYTTTPGHPEAVLPDIDAVMHRAWAGVVNDPGTDFGLAFEDVSFDADEYWVSPSTNEHSAMNLRGWLIRADAEASVGVTNEALMREQHPELSFDLAEGAVSPSRGLVAIHGAGVDRREILRHLPLWLANGFSVLMIDCRDHGVSDGTGRGPSYGLRERHDAAAAVKYASESLGWDDIVLFGTSQGGASVLLASSMMGLSAEAKGEEPLVDCVIAENPFAEKRGLWLDAINRILRGDRFGSRNLAEHNLSMWLIQKLGPIIPSWLLDSAVDIALWKIGYGWKPADALDTVDHMPHIRSPVLLLHGTDDTVVPPGHSQLLYDAATGARVKFLEWYEDARHGLLVTHDPIEYHKDISTFVRQCFV